MSAETMTLVIAEGVLVITCFLSGFLVGIAIWRERDSVRRRQREADRRYFRARPGVSPVQAQTSAATVDQPGGQELSHGGSLGGGQAGETR
jgi:hypothetical protein